MNTLPISNTFDFEQALQTERARLVRLCAYFSGDSNAAEDLAQETLLEAWRHADRLHDPSGYSAWLAAIARNVCLRYRRKKGHDSAILDVPTLEPGAEHDLTLDLDRADLALLLDRALALLPAETRAVLIAKYVDETPLNEIAQQLDTRQGTVAVRLHRGKLELKRLLENELRDDAAAFGLLPPAPNEWTETRVWCTGCGKHRFQMRLSDQRAEFAFRCPICNAEPNSYFAQSSLFPAVADLKTAKPLINRFAAWMEQYLGTAIEQASMPCFRCGNPNILRLGLPDYAPKSVQGQRGVHLKCTQCTAASYGTLDGLALNLELGRDFWRAHPRIHTLPERTATFQGTSAVQETFEAFDTRERFQVMYDAADYRVLSAWVEHA